MILPAIKLTVVHIDISQMFTSSVYLIPAFFLLSFPDRRRTIYVKCSCHCEGLPSVSEISDFCFVSLDLACIRLLLPLFGFCLLHWTLTVLLIILINLLNCTCSAFWVQSLVPLQLFMAMTVIEKSRRSEETKPVVCQQPINLKTKENQSHLGHLPRLRNNLVSSSIHMYLPAMFSCVMGISGNNRNGFFFFFRIGNSWSVRWVKCLLCQNIFRKGMSIFNEAQKFFRISNSFISEAILQNVHKNMFVETQLLMRI